MSEFYASPSTYRLRRRTPGTFVLVPSSKQGRSIRCQGQLEAAAAQVLVACSLVATVEEQPLSIWYAWHEKSSVIQILDGPPTLAFRKRHHVTYIVPDFLVTMQDGRKRLIEVKPSSKLANPDVGRKLTVGRLFAERHGWSFHVVTESDLFAGPLLANLRLIQRFRHTTLATDRLAHVETRIGDGPIMLGELYGTLVGITPPDVRAAVLHLVAVGRADLDPTTAAVSPTTFLSPKGTIRWDPFDSAWGPSGSWTSDAFESFANSIPTSSSPKT